jgi:hypothetical protein
MTTETELQVGAVVDVDSNYTRGGYILAKVMEIVGDEITVQPLGLEKTIMVKRDKVKPANYRVTEVDPMQYIHTVQLAMMCGEIGNILDRWIRERVTDDEIYDAWCYGDTIDRKNIVLAFGRR